MSEAQTIYAESAFRSLPRLLSLADRNPLSRTYGCFHRDYWLYKTSDFPDAVRQCSVHALALVYAHDLSGAGHEKLGSDLIFGTAQVSGSNRKIRSDPNSHAPRNPYYRNAKIRDWTIAALNFWTQIQHRDGSFDEFYPFERGWVGPTAFTTYASSEAYRLLRPEIPRATAARIETALRRAAEFIAAGETEEDHLANHHAMAYLAVSTAADVLDDAKLRGALPKLWAGFLQYHDAEEGWSLEYDGADPGYLSATVSFLAKVYARRPTPEMRKVLERAVEFCSYFAYPNGSYAGTSGSRNTLHFYPHGFELLSKELPLAASIAERMAQALADGKLVPPEIMSDRYVHYRVPEFLLASLDAGKRPETLPALPYERPAFTKRFPNAGIVAAVHGPAYSVANLAKGGVLKSFNTRTGEVYLNDTGWVGELGDGTLVTSQWIAPTFSHHANPETTPKFGRRTAIMNDRNPAAPGNGGTETRWQASGKLRRVPAAQLFTLWNNLVFRSGLGLLGWYPPAAHWMKGKIRKTLILGSAPVACTFARQIAPADDRLTVTDELRNDDRLQFRRLILGGEYPIRHVPQSRFFQSEELCAVQRVITEKEIRRLNQGEPLRITRTARLASA